MVRPRVQPANDRRAPANVCLGVYLNTAAQLRAAERHSPGVALNRARKLLLKCDRSLKPQLKAMSEMLLFC